MVTLVSGLCFQLTTNSGSQASTLGVIVVLMDFSVVVFSVLGTGMLAWLTIRDVQKTDPPFDPSLEMEPVATSSSINEVEV